MGTIRQIQPDEARTLYLQSVVAQFRAVLVNAPLDWSTRQNLLYDLRCFESLADKLVREAFRWMDGRSISAPWETMKTARGEGLLPRDWSVPTEANMEAMFAELDTLLLKHLSKIDVASKVYARTYKPTPVGSVMWPKELAAWRALISDAARTLELNRTADAWIKQVAAADPERTLEVNRATDVWIKDVAARKQLGPIPPGELMAASEHESVIHAAVRGLRRSVREAVGDTMTRQMALRMNVLRVQTTLAGFAAGLAILGFALSFHKVLEGADWKEEVVELLVGSAGAAAGGAGVRALMTRYASSACGVWQPVCNTLGNFLGGLLGAYLTLESFDYARTTLAYRLRVTEDGEIVQSR